MRPSGTGTSVSSKTATVSRADFLGKLLKYVAKSTLRNDTLSDRIENGVVRNQWIETIHIQGLDSAERICAEIVMRIDWDRYRLNINNGEREVEYDLDRSPSKNVSGKIDALIDIFIDVVEENGLKSDWAINYGSDVNRELVREVIGTSPSKREWKPGTKKPVGGVNPKKYNEFYMDLSIAVSDDEDDPEPVLSGVIENYGSRGFGFLRLYKKVGGEDRVFFHISNVINKEAVARGRTATFSLEKDAKGLRAVNMQVE